METRGKRSKRPSILGGSMRDSMDNRMSFSKARHGGTSAHGDTIVVSETGTTLERDDLTAVGDTREAQQASSTSALGDAFGSHRSAIVAACDILMRNQLLGNASMLGNVGLWSCNARGRLGDLGDDGK
ncbi:unnamed protein product [Ilex paraguariensis]|uniref:Uncharacterized protein n=1 Tax=Ilex paraguariensis TaxID=185542 RepID=A0ABC8UEY5_9AQUA